MAFAYASNRADKKGMCAMPRPGPRTGGPYGHRPMEPIGPRFHRRPPPRRPMECGCFPFVISIIGVLGAIGALIAVLL